MRLLAAAHSHYPRIGESAEEQRLRRAHGRLERGEITAADFAAIEDSVSRDAIAEQEAAGADLVTDGLVRWNDPVSHLARGFSGVEINGILRFFDTNTYYRQPIVRGKVAHERGILGEEAAKARAAAKRSLKAVLTGPYSLARFSRIEGGYTDLPPLVRDLAEGLAREAASAARAGAEWIQVEEPFLLQEPAGLPLVRSGLEIIAAARGKARILLATYFGDAAPLYEEIVRLPADGFGFDLCCGPGLAEKIRRAPPRVAALGIVDARNTRIEAPPELARRVRDLVAGGPEEAHLTTSAGLEYLPRQRAREKMALLAKTKALLDGG